jgi:energy-coupling factor transporter ATP-binding protein EcfA2
VASGIDLRGLRLERDGPDGPRLVVDGVDVVLAPGRRLALIGGNGSGKSTVLRHLAVPGVIPGRAAIVFQDPDEQLVAGAVAAEFALGAGPDAADTVTAWAAPFGLEAHLGLDARLLSAGQKQRLQLALALRSDPDLLLLDEPTSLQDETGAAWLRERLAAWPGAMVWATQRRDEAALCHDALVLRDGRPWREGPVGEVLADPDVQGILDPERLVDPGESGPPAGAGDGEPVCVVDDVSLAFAAGGGLGPVSLAVHAGDRLGVTGPNGCGKSTLLAAMAGLRRPDGGQVTLAGRPLYRHGDTDLDHGAAALAPQFPEYLFTARSVAGEVALDPALRRRPAGDLLAALGLTADLGSRHPHDLSGGQKRRLALGLALASGRPLILLDEPTAALDGPGRRHVLDLVHRAGRKAAVVIASHDRAFLRACGCGLLEL